MTTHHQASTYLAISSLQLITYAGNADNAYNTANRRLMVTEHDTWYISSTAKQIGVIPIITAERETAAL